MALVSPSFGQMQFLLSSLAFSDLKLTSCFSCKKRREKYYKRSNITKIKKQVLRFFKLCSALFVSLFPRNVCFMMNIALIFCLFFIHENFRIFSLLQVLNAHTCILFLSDIQHVITLIFISLELTF